MLRYPINELLIIGEEIGNNLFSNFVASIDDHGVNDLICNTMK